MRIEESNKRFDKLLCEYCGKKYFILSTTHYANNTGIRNKKQDDV